MRSLLHLVRPAPRVEGAVAEGPVGARVRALLDEAVARRASDVHLDPCESSATRCRLRVDGRFEEGPPIEPGLHDRIVARLKVLAGLPVAGAVVNVWVALHVSLPVGPSPTW